MKGKTARNDLFITIYSYSLISIILVILFTIVTNLYYFRLLLKDTEQQYGTSLQSVSETLNTTFREIMDTAALISTYEEFNNILFYPGRLSRSDYGHFYETQQTLSRFKTAKDSYINSVFIILSEENKIISNYGSSSIGEFTRITHISEEYDSLDWLLLDYREDDFTILPPGRVHNMSMGTEEDILPLVIYQADNRLFSNPLVIDIKQTSLSRQLEEERHTQNSILLIEDSRHNRVISSAGVRELSVPPDLSEGSRILRWKGQRFLVIGYRDEASLLHNWTYYAVVPYGDLVRSSLDKIIVPMIILMVSLFTSALVAYILSGRIYDPIGTLITSFRSRQTGESAAEPKGELAYLSREINRIIEDREKLSHELSQALPFVCERFLLSVLNGESHLADDEIRGFLSEHGFSFDSPCFAVVLTTINFTENFYTEYTRTDHDRICASILEAFQNYTREELRGYHFLMDSDRICSIYNLEESIPQNSLVKGTEEVHRTLDLDRSTLALASGVGQVHSGTDGMKISYREAVNSLGTGGAAGGGIIKFSKIAGDNQASYSIEEENILFNLILKGDRNETQRFIASLESKVLRRDVRGQELKSFYIQIYNTGKRILSLREVNDYDLMGTDYINVLRGQENLTPGEIKEYVALFLDKLTSSSRINCRQVNPENLKNYLDDHYREDLYLDKIGETFGITPKYASRVIKQELGMSFQKYISRLRIAKAKELLETTASPLSDIAGEIGYNSRHPFIRMFKILEGITPSEYRKSVAPVMKK